MVGAVAVSKGKGGKHTYLCALSYTERAMEAERRHRRGERQLFCPECELWRWPEECAHAGRLTEQQFTALHKRIERQIGRHPEQEDRVRREMRRALKGDAS